MLSVLLHHMANPTVFTDVTNPDADPHLFVEDHLKDARYGGAPTLVVLLPLYIACFVAAHRLVPLHIAVLWKRASGCLSSP